MKNKLHFTIALLSLVIALCTASAQSPQSVPPLFESEAIDMPSLQDAKIFRPLKIEMAIEQDGLLPFIVCCADDGHQPFVDHLLLDLAAHGFVIVYAENKNIWHTMDCVLSENYDCNQSYSNAIDAEYIGIMGIGSDAIRNLCQDPDYRASSFVAIDFNANESNLLETLSDVPSLYINAMVGSSNTDAYDAIKKTAGHAPVALANCMANLDMDQAAADEATRLINDWYGWMYKGQSNKRTAFVTSNLRGYSDKWSMTSYNFLTNYENKPMVKEAFIPHEFDPTYPDVHDPVVAFDHGKYYIFTTGFGIGLMSSDDEMKSWHQEPAPLDPIPAWACEMIPAYKGHTWAPDIIKVGDDWYLYYSCSTFGKNISAIGVATSKTLDSASADWHDLGLVVRSMPGVTDWNAIDPNVIVDANGNAWLTFGSFWDGIQLVPLAPDMKSTIGEPVTIARRRCPCKVAHWQEHANTNAIEAPFIFRHDDYYYLFVSYDYCCQGLGSTYKTAVGRSKSIDGPYIDRNDVDMADMGGEILIDETLNYAGVGHCAVYDFDGKTYFFAHAYDKEQYGRSKLYKRQIDWVDGWPVIVDK